MSCINSGLSKINVYTKSRTSGENAISPKGNVYPAILPVLYKILKAKRDQKGIVSGYNSTSSAATG